MSASILREGLEARFAEWRERGRRALIPYVTAGFPTAAGTGELLEAAAAAGADVVELGVPFSDPLADGPTIQRASFRALEEGMTVAGALRILEGFRARHGTPVVLFTYLNPVLRYGPEAFVRDAAGAGAEGLLVTDLPAGSDPELEARVREAGLDLIRLVAPTTPPERVRRIGASASGFLYYISRTGVTGARAEVRADLAGEVSRLRALVPLPVAVGFGISRPEHAALVASVADGVVVGSALLDEVERGGIAAGGAFLEGLREAMDPAGR